jgi:hypothetical protein
VSILHDRVVRCGNKFVPQLLIQWKGLPWECYTWETLFNMIDAFPSSLDWGHVGTPGGGNVTITAPHLAQALRTKRRTTT